MSIPYVNIIYSYLFGSISFFVIAMVLTLYPLYLLFVYGFVNMPKKRINIAAQKINKLRFEGFMQKLQHEVRLTSYFSFVLKVFYTIL